MKGKTRTRTLHWSSRSP